MWKTSTHGYADVSKNSPAMESDKKLYSKYSCYEYSSLLLLLPPIFLPHADSRLIVTNDYSVRKPSFHLHESFQRLSQWHVSVNARNDCIAALKGYKNIKEEENWLLKFSRDCLTCFPLERHFRIFGSMTSSRSSHQKKKNTNNKNCLWFNTRTDFSGTVALL